MGLSALAQNFLNVYGGAISVQTLRVPVTRIQAVILICALAYAISLWGHSGTEDKFSVFLDLTAYFIAPFATVLLLDYHVGGRSDPGRIAELYDRGWVLSGGFAAWAADLPAPAAVDAEHARHGRAQDGEDGGGGGLLTSRQ
ncbi:cytosine permease [Streptomyces antioxidans]|uniref:cytosine permease n=1 Tax=Streptomyces sp. HNM1019 TaxID=3424717 RepID=UPI001F0B6249|nr:cytosine permease [Streptomyces antioxidans]